MWAKTIAAWQFKLMRKSPRVTFVAPVQVLYAGEVAAATSQNLSAGGMLLETDCLLPVRARIHLHFVLPTGVGITTAARVVYSRLGRQYGIEFLEMESGTQAALRKAVQVKESSARRSIRLPERLFVTLHWQGLRRSKEQVAETVLLSRHGCLVLSKSAPPCDTCLQLRWPEKQMEISARVVSSQPNGDGTFRVALEFTDDADFWGIELPAHSASSSP